MDDLDGPEPVRDQTIALVAGQEHKGDTPRLQDVCDRKAQFTVEVYIKNGCFDRDKLGHGRRRLQG